MGKVNSLQFAKWNNIVIGKWNTNQLSTLKVGLLSIWEFDETTGTPIDAKGANTMAVQAGSPTINQTGKINKAVYFSGGSKYRINPLNSVVASAGGISLWFNISNYQNYTEMIGCYPYDSNRYIGWYCYQGNFYAYTGSGAQLLVAAANASYLTNRWTHVLSTWDASYFYHYLDGVFIGQTANSLNPPSYIEVGGAAWGGAFMTGYYDQFALWTKTLNAGEVSMVYNSGNGLAYSLW